MCAELRTKKSLRKTILSAGLLVGTLDAIAAIIMYVILVGKNPVIIFNYIASGVFGKNAFAENVIMPLCGLIFHYMIAYTVTIFFFLVYPRIKFMQKNTIVSGLLYGLFVWLIMNLIVIPLSNTPAATFHVAPVIRGIIILMIAIGLPLSFIANKFYSENKIRT